MDLHKRESQLCILAPDAAVTDQRIVTSRERFTSVLGNRAAARILLEASTESEWVARHLQSPGHEVIVADPKLRTDVRDARVTCEDWCARARAMSRSPKG